MTDSLFSIFPDSQLASGNDLKGKVARSKKQALCDVKNILQAKRTTGNEPLRKFGVQVPSGSQQFPVKGTPAKCLPVSEGTFKVACDDETASWDSCGSCTKLDEGVSTDLY
ncbi:hypothetical protein ONE63_002984 [Megalurothrips usitatus]|uniref:Uncharacterized protein n=1 Tax=Megalurothrips usitatus TaxID=439358 RepID=A0AAV7X6P2_9NEOP|nr:hypothetical protein ONE63_002984 [Megalurothrips usitatus]